MRTLQSGLLFDGIDKHFCGTCALKDVSLTVARGEILALLGEACLGYIPPRFSHQRGFGRDSNAFDPDTPYRGAYSVIWND